MQEQTSRIMKLAVRYLLASDVKTKDGKPRCYEEQLVLDRNTHSITYTQTTSPRYQITKTCYVEDGIARLLDELDPDGLRTAGSMCIRNSGISNYDFL